MPGFNHTTENMKTKTLLGFFLLSVMAFCVSACQDDAEIILFSGSELSHNRLSMTVAVTIVSSELCAE